ncbi:hypothetical protein [Clostridium sp. Ade.TY]|uniref:hypothetical protein n=1 Tax=Clostridium sp. Ade.TY TaxID=1391647 RepID=UPI0004053789|nr:hypothetical protein [Clostridium sp. Ade.TY]
MKKLSLEKPNGIINADFISAKIHLNVYIVERKDDFDWDEYKEQTIVAESEKRAIELANREYGEWQVKKSVDLTKEQVLTKAFNAG